MLQRVLIIAQTQLKAGNLVNEICQIICSLYWAK